jgi:hypothetical protein
MIRNGTKKKSHKISMQLISMKSHKEISLRQKKLEISLGNLTTDEKHEISSGHIISHYNGPWENNQSPAFFHMTSLPSLHHIIATNLKPRTLIKIL